MPRARLVLTAALVGGWALLAAPAAPAEATFFTFKLPSGNIGCAYANFPGESPTLRCDIRSGLVPRPPRPPDCDLDWGYGYVLAVKGHAQTFCAGDTVLNPKARSLAYGKTWSHDGFTCTARTTGLTCRNRAEHGFQLSRGRSGTF